MTKVVTLIYPVLLIISGQLNGASGNVAIQGHTVFCKFTCYTNGDKEWSAYMYYN